MTSIPASAQSYLPNPRKRLRTKSVSWAAEDKLNQVRLFAAEDAPSLSGSVLQDLLEAKRSKFMHSLVPVPGNDLPPGFESIAAKRARLNASPVPAMVTQILWRYPERFIYDPSWQVCIGDESSEAALQTQREVRVLEAIYPRLTAIPASPAELQEIPTGGDDAVVPNIPLIPIEDEEDGVEEDFDSKGSTGSKFELFSSSSASSSSSSSASILSAFPSVPMSTSSPQISAAPLSYPPGYSPPRDDKKPAIGGAQSGVPNTDFATTFLQNAGPDVAAAAAAAYAVLKAKENGALIDHELLIKILNNPLLIETLTASNPSLNNQSAGVAWNNNNNNQQLPPYRASMNGNGLKVREPSFGEGGAHMGPSGSAQAMLTRQRYDMPSVQGNPPWGPVAANALGSSHAANALGSSQSRGAFPGEVSAVHGQAYINASHSYPLPRHDIPRDVIQPHLVMPGAVGTNDATPFLPNLAPMMSFEGKALEHDLEQRLQMANASSGSMGGQPWPGNSGGVVLSSPLMSTASSQDRAPTGPKVKKQCFFFNTPKGCRNGAFCNFLHGPEKPHHERTNSSSPETGQGTGSGMQGGGSKAEREEGE